MFSARSLVLGDGRKRFTKSQDLSPNILFFVVLPKPIYFCFSKYNLKCHRGSTATFSSRFTSKVSSWWLVMRHTCGQQSLQAQRGESWASTCDILRNPSALVRELFRHHWPKIANKTSMFYESSKWRAFILVKLWHWAAIGTLSFNYADHWFSAGG